MSTERPGWREWLIVLGFLLSIVIAGVFLVRSLRVAARFHQDEPIRPWMTIPYIARSYRVPPAILFEALGLAASPRDRRPLTTIARQQHRPVQEVIDDLQQAIRRAREAAPPGPEPLGNAP